MIRNRFLYTALMGCGLAFTGMALAQDSTAPTADQQKMNAPDRKLTQKIRRAVVADKTLSTDAHNVKIISQNGMVTLRGPVRSEDERKAVVAKAAEIAGGSDKVTDQLTVKP
jgi:osmotically-inducible protein OsmY